MGGFVNALASVVAGYRTPQIAITAPSWAQVRRSMHQDCLLNPRNFVGPAPAALW